MTISRRANRQMSSTSSRSAKARERERVGRRVFSVRLMIHWQRGKDDRQQEEEKTLLIHTHEKNRENFGRQQRRERDTHIKDDLFVIGVREGDCQSELLVVI